MNKSYSNKALPSGTVLREWRLEEVLGVGGFGIVYKGRGIYFDELVAIKEYFPSSISERKDGDTVVPIDSDAEEVHALGLKKFVEEAKLLWNLSTPTRHPNIVSVRSLFEIHGTAYMVMDFEDGVSLSRWLKEGRRFNQASLMGLVAPIAQGLERAHRVGVLHRDIKPPNILINEDGRPVLIDFGSARFESGEATSTTVTFHTPPYAAIEQYVKTYPQGPWTDVYALGVVLYECVTGTKPPEVLERLHGGLGTPLADGVWPGYSRAFLEGVDAAMTIRPGDRPQSVSEWLAMFDESQPARGAVDDDDEARTQIHIAPAAPDVIVPVAPPPPGFQEVGAVETGVPDSTRDVKYKRAGEDTSHRRQDEGGEMAPPPLVEQPPEAVPKGKAAGEKGQSGSRKAVVIAALLGAAAAGSGWFMAQRGTGASQAAPGEAVVEDSAEASTVGSDGASIAPVAADDPAGALQALAATARAAGAPGNAALNEAQGQMGQLAGAQQAALAQGASQRFAAALAADGQARARRLAATPSDTPERQRAAADLRGALARLNSAAAEARAASSAELALPAASRTLAAWRGVAAALGAAARAGGPAAATTTPGVPAGSEPASSAIAAGDETPTSVAASAGSSGGNVTSGQRDRFNKALSAARAAANDVIRQSQAKAGQAGDAETKRLLAANAKSAQDYLGYLDTMANSMRGARSEQEAQRLTEQAEQTRRYLTVLKDRVNTGGR
ncbi:serine/threonine protein kinase [Novosphingobium flavum]|uniref:Serine/threonine protein kinase n=1 Tax=Novosphingobium flavum TaxID=1778672 RepID=A0A7X1FQU6_9SPHN|nr:serine/threonine-protein kinase [Novosphingobium flavum]MBC2665273.1 serine/threonine protein kinase [Novosphingobium flavum]